MKATKAVVPAYAKRRMATVGFCRQDKASAEPRIPLGFDTFLSSNTNARCPFSLSAFKCFISTLALRLGEKHAILEPARIGQRCDSDARAARGGAHGVQLEIDDAEGARPVLRDGQLRGPAGGRAGGRASGHGGGGGGGARGAGGAMAAPEESWEWAVAGGRTAEKRQRRRRGPGLEKPDTIGVGVGEGRRNGVGPERSGGGRSRRRGGGGTDRAADVVLVWTLDNLDTDGY